MLIAKISTFIQCNYQVQNIFSCFSSGTEQHLQQQTEVQRSNIVHHHFHHLQFSRVNSCIGSFCYSETSFIGGGRIFTYAVYNLQHCLLRTTDVRQQRRRSPMTNCSAPFCQPGNQVSSCLRIHETETCPRSRGNQEST